jgi:mRNA-degrading endonuclease RelE of RelBE toxin-antitoxin system
MKRILIAVTALFISGLATGQDVIPQDAAAQEKEAAYVKTITARSAKIVEKLNISDSGKFRKTVDVIAWQYRNLNDIYKRRDNAMKQLKEAAGAGSKPDTTLTKAVDASVNKSLDSLHKTYLKQLGKLLNEHQVEEVKNGMTYNVLNVTYTSYLDMVPSLTEPQKKQLYDWLVEAREHAMDAESSDKKHWWFGKYKGRINNYLSKEGYDIQKERADWEQRLKERQAAKKAAN